MKKRTLLFALLLMGAIVAKAQSAQPDFDDKYATELVKAGTAAPDFKMKTPDGNNFQFSKWAKANKGKTVVLDFWASWCPDCRKDAPEVVRLYEKYRQYGVEFIGISMDTDVEAWKKAIEMYGITYPQVSELKKFKETDIAKAYGVKWIPSMVVVGPDGEVKLSTVLTYKVDKYLKELTTTTVQEMQMAMAQGFKNPVLPGFHADPSVCRAGDDFYLVNSTFQYFPGVPVFHSKDLVNWEQVGNCLTRPSQVDLTGTDGNSGIYAPTIRYHEGRFYMVTTVFPSRRHFYVWTDNPAGEWSEPIVIDFAIGSCDPTLFFDDGRCYFLWKEGDIKICEIDVETGKQLGEIHHLGTGLGGRYPEGPHIYKKDGWYYLLLAEGGTEHGHHVNILRSRSLFGPYEPNPGNPILSHFNMKMQNSPIQGLGHADLVQAPDDSWWMICLGYRTSGYLQHVMGRETMLAPVQWEQGGWPVVNGDGTLQIDMQCKTLPIVSMPQDPVREEFNYVKRNAPADSYHSVGLPMGWMSLCNPDYSKYSLAERKGFLRIRPGKSNLSETAIPSDAPAGSLSPTFVARRQTELNFSATALFDLSHLTEGMQAGITAYAAPLNHYDVVTERREGKLFVKSSVRLGQTCHSEKEFPLSGDHAYLRITSDKDFYYMQASSDGASFTTLAKMEYRFLSTETIGGFTGVMIGLFTQASQETKGYVDVDWFEYK